MTRAWHEMTQYQSNRWKRSGYICAYFRWAVVRALNKGKLFMEMITLEQTPEGSQRVNEGSFWTKNILELETVQSQSLKTEADWWDRDTLGWPINWKRRSEGREEGNGGWGVKKLLRQSWEFLWEQLGATSELSWGVLVFSKVFLLPTSSLLSILLCSIFMNFWNQ